jgi:hypothetical protein
MPCITLVFLSTALLADGACQEPVDTSFFQVLSSDKAVVAYGAGDSLRAVRTLGYIESQGALPGLPPSYPTSATVYLAPSEEVFESLTGGVIPEWGVGVAIPGAGVVVIPAFASDRTRGWDERRVLRHEWAHLGLSQFLQSVRIPRWFNEGYAEWASGGWDATQGWRLRVAFATGRAPALDSISLSWPRDRGAAELAYMLSATAVEYLVRASGERALELFLSTWRESGSFDGALRSVYGVTQGQFEEDWQEYVKGRYGWFLVLTHSLVFWLALALMLLLMVWIRRGRNRLAMARLRATEPPERPAYWTDDDGEAGTNAPGSRSSSGPDARSDENG